jgi:hypothetical protein
MRVLLVIIGALAGLAGLYCAGSGFVTYRAVDSDGFITSDRAVLVSSALAITTQAAEIETESRNLSSGSALIRVRAEREDGGPVFVGIGRSDLVQAYLLGSRYEALTSIQFSPFEFNARTIPGRSTEELLDPPDSRTDIWAASSSGAGLQETSYSVIKDETGRVIDHIVVIMNADPSAGIAVEAEYAVKYPRLRGTGIAFMVIGTVVFLLGTLMVVVGIRSGGDEEDEPAEPPPEPEPPLFG